MGLMLSGAEKESGTMYGVMWYSLWYGVVWCGTVYGVLKCSIVMVV